jgi:hypothetical protein
MFFTAPAPSIFTYQKKYKTKIFFDRYINNIKIDSIEFNKSFYKSLGGPHRYKVAFNSNMNRGGRLVQRDNYSGFIEYFICNHNVPRTNKVSSVQVRTEKKTLRVFRCYE